MVLVVVVAVVVVYLSIYLSYLSACLSASLKTKLFCETSSAFELDNIKNETILRDFLNFWTWQHQNNSARLPIFELDNVKNETSLRDFLNFWTWQHQKRNSSARLELDNVKNETILRDFLNFRSWQHQKRNNSARLPQFSKLTTSKTKPFCETSVQNGKLSAELRASYQRVLIFFHSTCLKCCACHENWCEIIRSAVPVT